MTNKNHADAPRTIPIAVVGVGALFPGSTTTIGFWRDIVEGRDRLTDVPRSHWLAEDYFDPKPGTPDKVYATRGGFLPDVDFAPLEFGCPPNTVPATDTAQLLALVVAKHVLEEATRGRYESMDRSRMSVILGVASATELVAHMSGRLQKPVWEHAMRAAGLDAEQVARVSGVLDGCYVPWQESTFPGLLGNVVAGRITNRLDLGGTNAVVDAACAGSLAAVSMAVNDLALGNSDLVITGGVDALNDILMYMCFAQTGALSLSGDCRPFSDQCDGTMLGEGIGMLALKRLDQAERDGDAIYAVIRGLGASSDGRAKSIYAPSAQGQVLALARAYERAGYGPETVGLVEAHGTGTQAGDAAEFEALARVFDAAGAPRRETALGSVKSQVGHTKAAAGAAGLIKAVMALHHKVLPPTIKVRAPDPRLAIDTSAFYLNTEARPWIHAAAHARRASVSALGFGGTNFHVTLEEYCGPSARPARLHTSPTELVVLSAATPEALAAKCREASAAATAPGALVHLARSSQRAFDATAHARVAVVAVDEADARDKLAFAAEAIAKAGAEAFTAPRGVYYACGPQVGSIAVLFPGQGSQYVGMSGDLAMRFECVRAVWDRAAAALRDGAERLEARVFPPPVFDDEARREQAVRLTATEWAQPAITTASLAMWQVLGLVGVRPVHVGGHSLGEVTAACAVGLFDETTAVRVARRRGELMAGASATPGAMTAVTATREDVQRLLAAQTIDVVLANHNSPRQVVLSGALAEIERAERCLTDAKLSVKRLPVSTAFHSRLVSASVAPFRAFLDGVTVGAAHVPLYCNATAAVYPAEADGVRAQLADAIARPVRFVEQLEAMYAAGARTFIEVGPDAVLSQLVARCLEGRPHVAVALDQRGRHGLTALWTALGRLAVAGVPVAFAPLWDDEALPRDPGAESPAKFSIKLNGANYGKPYPPRSPDASPRAVVVAAPKPAPPPVVTTPALAAPSRESAVRMSPAREDTGSSSASHAIEPAWIDSLARLQAPAIAAQMEFQRVMAESHIAFLRAFESSYASLGLAGNAPALVASAGSPRSVVTQVPSIVATPAVVTPVPVVAQPEAPRAGAIAAVDLMPVVLAIVAEKTGYPAEMIDTEMDLEADLGIDSIRRVEILSAMRERVPDLPQLNTARLATMRTLGQIVAYAGAAAPEPTGAPVANTATPARASGVVLTPILLAIVAEKTGYPAEMIDTDMDLESDLGIDSIKRVEILSAMRQRVPDLPQLDTARLATMRTLGQIVAYAGVAAPASAAPVALVARPATASVVELTSVLLAIVAEKTGYPAEMIDTDMDLESDLGIDSIKRVEILSAMRQRVPDLPQLNTARLATMRTLGQIVAYAGAGGEPGAATQVASTPIPSSSPTPTAGAPHDAVSRVVVRAVPAPSTGFAVPGLFGRGPIAVTPDGGGVASGLVERLRARGVSACVAGAIPADAIGVIFLGGLRAVTDDDAIDANREAFAAARAVAARFREHGGVFVTVQDTSGDFGLAGSCGARAWLAGISALAKTAGNEWPGAAVKAIDVERGARSDADIADALVSELLAGGPETEVGLRADGSRVTLATVRVELPAAGDLVEPGAVFVVSGGARGVTAASMIALARVARPRIVMLGRTALEDEPAGFRGAFDEAALKRLALDEAKRDGTAVTPKDIGARVEKILAGREVRETVARLTAAGATVRYAPVDVRDATALGALLDDVRRAWGPIGGLVHGAGVLADAFIDKKTDAQFDRVFDTKVLGLRALLDATRGDPLESLCLFSSVAARTGNAGQADYAMANEVLNKVAAVEARRRNGRCRVVAIGWGPWDGGMVTPALRGHFAARGVALLSVAAGADAFVRELRAAPGDDVEVVIGGGDAAVRGARATRPRVEVLVSAKTHPQLESHRIQGRLVLPVVLVVEWFARLARSVFPERAITQLRDVRVLRGVTLAGFDGPGDRFTIAVTGAPDADVALELRDETGAVRLAATVDRIATPVAATPLNGAQLAESPWSLEEVYSPRALFHGRDFQVIRSIEGISTDGAHATLAGTRSVGWPDEAWHTDPAAVDGALQVAFLCGLRTMGGGSLPLRIGRIGCTGHVADGAMRCVLRVTSRTAERVVCDIAVSSADGAPVTDLVDVEMYVVPSEIRAS